MKAMATLVGLLVTGTALAEASDLERVMGAISIDANQKVHNASTVNGSIQVGDHATVAHVSTVNGHITLGAGTSADSLSTVNGGIDLGFGSRVSGDVSSVNGSVTLQRAADISGRLSNVNGRIWLLAAHVGGGIETGSGSIEVGSDSRVEGGLLVKKHSEGWLLRWWFSWHHAEVPVIVIAPHAIIQGTLRFEREVKLYVSDHATVGPIEGARAVIYPGDRP